MEKTYTNISELNSNIDIPETFEGSVAPLSNRGQHTETIIKQRSLPFYWYAYTDACGNIYSIDGVRVKIMIPQKNLPKFNKLLNGLERTDVQEYPECRLPFRYRFMYTINYADAETTLTVGYHFNCGEPNDGMFDFNPNKLLVHESDKAISDLNRILALSSYYEIKRWDLAIDIPFKREDVFLIKDRRTKTSLLKSDKYEIRINSAPDSTEYLGKRNSDGFVKLYNKTKESNLSTDLTRLEITFGDTETEAKLKAQLKKYFPRVAYPNSAYTLDYTALKPDEIWRIHAILSSENPEALILELKHNNYHIWKKINIYVQGNCMFVPDINIIQKLSETLYSSFEYRHFKII